MPLSELERKDRHRESSRRSANLVAFDSRDIGPPPPIEDPARRLATHANLRLFCETYFPSRFALAWSPDHIQVLARIEEAICHGGLFALAMPRGGGKSSICSVALLWAGMTARHPFAMLVAVNARQAGRLLDSVKTELLSNDLLHEDWPEIIHPIRALEGRANRSKGQHIGGTPTHVGWRADEVVFPTVAGSAASGVVLRVAGLTGGNLRGQTYTRPSDGATVRPSLVILDDPQDRKCALSPFQIEKRFDLIHSDVLGMAGPGKKMTCVMPCTIIQPSDLSARMLDRQQSPLWTGQRYQLLPRLPDRMDLWDQYGTMRKDEFRNGGDGHLATAWYGQQKEVMDLGAIASWPERHHDDELSALQHALNLRIDLGEAAWLAEYQNDPRAATMGTGDQLQVEALRLRVNGLERGTVPLVCGRVVAAVDVQQKALYWMVAAFADDFTGTILDYGTYPDQQRAYYGLADLQRTLARAAPGAGLEGSIHAGMERLSAQLFGREWFREDGVSLRIERLLVDAGFQTDTVKTWCRSTDRAALVTPSHGRGIGAKHKPMHEYAKAQGDKLGWHWMLTAGMTGKAVVRHILIDTNHWKTFAARRLQMAAGDKGAMLIYGKVGQDHRLLADHLCSEYFVSVEANGRRIDEWQQRPDRSDNHFLDCLTNCYVAASFQGCSLPEVQARRPVSSPASRASYDAKRRAFEQRRGY